MYHHAICNVKNAAEKKYAYTSTQYVQQVKDARMYRPTVL